MPFAVKKYDLPENALLRVYRDSGAFTDCYATEVDGQITQAALLAIDEVDSFAAWSVEARNDDQILLTDFRGQTRSWLMSEQLDGGDSTRLYFGSAVMQAQVKRTGERRLGKSFSAFIYFHKLYSKILLSSARRRLS